jgi:rod shape-determining protein MreC
MLIAGVLLIALSGIGVLRPVEDIASSLLSPFERLARGVARPMADLVANFGDIRELSTENEALRTENQRLSAEVARLREEAARREELERLLEVKRSLSDLDFLTARVVARDPSNLRQRLAIDRGTKDGVRNGMTVVTEGSALVGTVTQVTEERAWVTLVTDIDSAVSGVVLESRAQGVVAGSYSRRLAMEFVAQGAAVREADTVVTSGVGGTYPPGLVIGRVTGVAGARNQVFRSVTVEPLASLSRLETVLVVTSFIPSQVAPP